MPTHAYLCFDAPDRGYGRRLAQFLIESGIRVWWDTRNELSDAIDETAKRMVTTCGALVVVVSKRSVRSPKLHRVLAAGEGTQRPIILLVIDNVTVPPSLLHLQRERIRMLGMPPSMIVEQLKDLTGLYEPSDEDDEFGPAAAAPASRAARTPRISTGNKAVAIIVGIALIACVAWQPSAVGAVLGFAGSFVSGIATFFRALTG